MSQIGIGNSDTGAGSSRSISVSSSSSQSCKKIFSTEIKKTATQGNKDNSLSTTLCESYDMTGCEPGDVRNTNKIDGFVEVKHKKRKISYSKATSNNPSSMTGRANVNNKNLIVVEKNRYVFVSRFSENVEWEAVRDYMNDSVKGNYEVSKLKNRYPGYSSFKVGVPLSLWSKVFNADFCRCVYISRFRYPRRSHTLAPKDSFLGQNQEATTVK